MFVNARLLSRALVSFGMICCALVSSVHAEPTQALPPDTTRVASQLCDSGLHDEFAYEFLRELTTRFGARPAGSENASAAMSWGADVLRSAGLRKVTIERFPLQRWRAENAERRWLHGHRFGTEPRPLGSSQAWSQGVCHAFSVDEPRTIREQWCNRLESTQTR